MVVASPEVGLVAEGEGSSGETTGSTAVGGITVVALVCSEARAGEAEDGKVASAAEGALDDGSGYDADSGTARLEVGIVRSLRFVTPEREDAPSRWLISTGFSLDDEGGTSFLIEPSFPLGPGRHSVWYPAEVW
jgi:hypothetical protein